MLTSKEKGIVVAASFAMVVVVIAGVVWVRNADILVSHYPTMKEAVDDGARKRGWLPSFVPEGAFDLHEAHDIDTNLQWGTFRFGDADAETLIGMLVAAEEDCRVRVPDPGLENWPVDRARALSCEELGARGYRVFWAPGDPRGPERFWVLVREAGGRAAYWTEFGTVRTPR